MELPTLYKRTQTGSIEEWQIKVTPHWYGSEPGQPLSGAAAIHTQWGQRGGSQQDTTDVITEGKNVGKANSTTPLQQAEKEAKALWTKKLKKGYVQSLEAAEAGEVDEIIEGGIPPMLAPNKSYPKDQDLVRAIEFPCYAQPKLDGMRCIAVIENGKASLWSRTRKRINSVPHIVEALEKRFGQQPDDRGGGPEELLVLDGELYAHAYAERFEDLISILRKDEPDAEGLYKDAQYHMYDLVQWSDTQLEYPFWERTQDLHWLLDGCEPPLFCVDTVKVATLAALGEVYEACLKEGYEGAMARNAHGPYEAGKRSKHVQKMKEFEDHEMTIVGVNDGRGKDAGTAATFSVMLPCLCCGKGNPAKVAKARLKATYDKRRALFANGAELTGKKVTVTMKRWTEDGMPYLPVAKALRDYE